MKVCIVGFGLIGSSLAWQLKAKGHRVAGIARRQETLDAAIKYQLIDECYLEVCSTALLVDVVIVALPLELIVPAVLLIEKFLKGPTVVVDVGSVKSHIVEEVVALGLKKTIFVGGHPMAGSDKSGIEHFQKGLFMNKPFVVCYPDIQVRLKATKIMMELVRDLGARYIELSPAEHDQQVATISHMPYIVANALYKLYQKDENKLKMVASTGFYDTTRVAHSDPMWGTMVAIMNDSAIVKQLDDYIASLVELKAEILMIDPKSLFDRFNVDHVEEEPRKMQLVEKWVQDYHTKI